jgi:hypothetical protein
MCSIPLVELKKKKEKKLKWELGFEMIEPC